MPRWSRFLGAVMPLCFALLTASARSSEPPVTATVETTLGTAGENIRQFAFDGDAGTFFASAKIPSDVDHFTLRFDKPVALKSVAVATGRPEGDKLDAGTLQASRDGKKFEPVAKFVDGTARAKLADRQVQALRIQPAPGQKHPLVIREITLASTPAVTVFKYPVEFVVNVKDAPEMKEWAEKTARVCEHEYARINDELKSDGFRPPRLVRMALKSSYRGVAATGGDRIVGSVSYFKTHPADVGAMVHETAHVVQQYRTANNPSWLVEGIADYIRFFIYEPGKLGRLDPKRARYNGSYRVSAAFLAYLTDKYDKRIVRKLNKMMREGEYSEAVFKKLTGKTLPELGKEWQASLQR